MSQLDQHIAHVQNRLASRIFVRALAFGALLAASIVWGVILVRKFVAFDVPYAGWAILALAAAVFIGALVYSMLRRPTPQEAAVAIDAELGTLERFATALYARNQSDPFARASLEDAERTAANVSLYKRFPLATPRHAYTAGWIAAAAALTFFLMPQVTLFGQSDPVAKKQQTLEEQRSKQVREAVKQALVQVNSMPKAMVEDEKIQTAKKELEALLANPPKDPTKASLSAMKKLEQMNQALSQKIEESQKFAEAQNDARMFSSMEPPIDEKGPIADAQRAMVKGDFSDAVNQLKDAVENFDKMEQKDQEKTVQQMQQMARQLQQMANDPKQQQKMQQQLQRMGANQQQAQQMQQLMQQAAQGNQQAQQQLQQAAQQMMQQMNNGQGPNAQQQQQIQQMMQQMQAQANTQQQAQQMAQAAQQMAQAMQQAAGAQAAAQQNNPNGQQQGQQQGQQGQQAQQGGQGQQMQQAMAQMQQQLQAMQAAQADAQQVAAAQQAMQDAQAAAQAAANGQQGQGQQGQGQQGQGQGNQPGQGQQQQGQGQGQWAAGDQQNPGQGMGGPGQGQGGQAPIAQAPFTVKPEFARTQDQKDGQVLASFYVKAGSIKGESKEQLKEVAAAAEHDATDEVEQERIPRQSQRAVREYFKSIEDDVK